MNEEDGVVRWTSSNEGIASGLAGITMWRWTIKQQNSLCNHLETHRSAHILHNIGSVMHDAVIRDWLQVWKRVLNEAGSKGNEKS